MSDDIALVVLDKPLLKASRFQLQGAAKELENTSKVIYFLSEKYHLVELFTFELYGTWVIQYQLDLFFLFRLPKIIYYGKLFVCILNEKIFVESLTVPEIVS